MHEVFLSQQSVGAVAVGCIRSVAGRGIFTPADHPPHPQDSRKAKRPPTPPRWLLRTSYGGLMNVSWPGSRPVTLEPGKPLTLKYRIYVHEGDAEMAQVAKAYADYTKEQP